MLRIKWLVQIALITCIFGSMVYAEEVIETFKIPDAVATVNGVNITGQEIKRRMAQSRAMDPDRFDSMSLAERGEGITRVIDNMVTREVIYQEAVRKGVVVTDEEIGMSLNDLKRQFLSEEAFEKAFAGANITISAWKEETRKSLMGLKLEGLMVEEVKISDSEIAEYYEKNKAHFNRDSIHDKKAASEQTLEDHREHVGSILRQVKWQQLKFEWVKTLMDNAVVWKWSPL